MLLGDLFGVKLFDERLGPFFDCSLVRFIGKERLDLVGEIEVVGGVEEVLGVGVISERFFVCNIVTGDDGGSSGEGLDKYHAKTFAMSGGENT